MSEEKNKVGRPSKYKPEEARRIIGKIVYGLTNDEGEIFYIGSTLCAKNRFMSYINLNAHKNNRLLENLKKNWFVIVMYEGDDFRDVEILKIKEFRPKCNFSSLTFNNKRYGSFWAYVKKYKNMFGDTDFINELKEYFRLLDDNDKQIVDNRFKVLMN